MPQTLELKPRRLIAEDFVALRSLAKHRWVQGDKIEWKFNRTWCVVSYSEAPALDAADRLISMALAEETICCSGCSRAVIQLTAKGMAFVNSLDHRKPAIESPSSSGRGLPDGWLARLARLCRALAIV